MNIKLTPGQKRLFQISWSAAGLFLLYQMGTAFLSLGLTLVALLCGYRAWQYQNTDLRRHANIRDREQAETDLIRAKAANLYTDAAFRTEKAGTGILSWNTGTVQYWHTRNPHPETRNPHPETRNPQLETRNPQHATRNPHPETALDVATDADRAFINGGTRSGKTFFCKNLAALRVQRGDMVFAIDPKDQTTRDPWPDDVVVIGDGDNWGAIEQFFNWLDDEKVRRGADMDNTDSCPFILIFFDEINDCLYERPDFKDRYIRILRKYAQYRIGIFCIGQTDTVDSIGLRGLSQLKQCFDLVLSFRYNKFEKNRLSFADYQDGRGQIPLAPYRPLGIGYNPDTRHTDTPQKRPDTPVSDIWHDTATQGPTQRHRGSQPYDDTGYISYDTPPPQGDTQTHRDIIGMYQAGASFNKIALSVFGTRGGRQTREIKSVLAEYGII